MYVIKKGYKNKGGKHNDTKLQQGNEMLVQMQKAVFN